MGKNLFVVFILFLYSTTSFAQASLNQYKYIIVPKKYEFSNENDKFELNSLTKFLFKKAGFQTLSKGEDYPDDLLNNPCLAVLVNVKDNSSMFTTKLTLELSDCHNKVVFTTQEGRSKEKDYKKTYQEALRKSFASVEALNYEYNPDLEIVSEKKQVTEISEVSEPSKVETKPKEVKTATIVAAPVVVDEVKEDKNTKTEIKSEEVKTETIVDVPFVVIEDTEVKEEPSANSVARSFKNENISFFLINQNNGLGAYVIESKIDSYKKGEMIGTFVKTSLPNVFKVSWKNKQKGIDETIAYFDDEGNLKIEINRNGKIEVVVFKAEK